MSSEKADNIQEVFEAIPEQFNADAASGVDAIFQFDISGEQGGKYWIKVVDQQVEVHEGEAEDPTITILSNAEDYLKMVNGELSPMSAFMQGKIKVKGNMGLAMKLQSMFGL